MAKIIKTKCLLCGEEYEWDEDEGVVHFCQAPQKVIGANLKKAIDSGQLKDFTEDDARKILKHLDDIGWEPVPCFLDVKYQSIYREDS